MDGGRARKAAVAMAYRFEKDESVSAAVERIAREELEAAARGLRGRGNRDRAIHEARKSVKKTRALLRLVREHRLNARLRDIGRGLADYRDATVVIETFDDLGAKGMAPVRRALVQQKKRPSAKVLEEIACRLVECAGRVDEWPPKKGAFERTVRKARKAMSRAAKSGRSRDFHEWRKRVKDHWYHERLTGGSQEERLKILEDVLGQDHNLEVLRTRAPQVSDLVDARQAKLRKQALDSGKLIYRN